MPNLSVDKGELHYEVFGDKGPWLFFVSGLGGHGAFWANQVEYFKANYRVVIHDHRGYGQSTGGSAKSGVTEACHDLRQLFDHLSVKEAILVGHSMGGMIAQEFAIKYPDLLKGLVIGASGPATDDYAKLILGFRRRVLETLGKADFCRLQSILTLGKMADNLCLSDIEAMEAQVLAGIPDSELVCARLKSIESFDSTDQLPKVIVPTLAVSAVDDDMASPRGGESIKTLIEGAELQLLSKGGHFFPKTVPDQYNSILDRFFTERARDDNEEIENIL